jgi:hypothetical protein
MALLERARERETDRQTEAETETGVGIWTLRAPKEARL